MPALDGAVAHLASRQHGRVAAWQVAALGMDREAIRHRVASGRWHVVHHGVYAVGHTAYTPLAKYMAAVLAAGPRAVASHRTAAALHGLQPHHHDAPHVVSTTRRRKRKGIHIHWTRSLRPDQTTTRQGIPVTTIVRTLQDLADVASPDEQEEAIRAAERRHRFDRRVLHAIPGRRGAAGVGGHRELLRGALEPVFRRLVLDAGFAPYAPNVAFGPYVIDAFWPQQRLAVEIDDFDTHGTRTAFDGDRVRDRYLLTRGLTPVRVTASDLTVGRAALIDHLRALGAPNG